MSFAVLEVNEVFPGVIGDGGGKLQSRDRSRKASRIGAGVRARNEN